MEGLTEESSGRRERVVIEKIAAGGDGLAHLADGRVVFVPRAAPGDDLELEIVEERVGWARGRIARIVEPGGERIEAPCVFYASCGGCQLQHLDYGAQLAAKAEIIAESLRRIAKLAVSTPEVEPAPAAWGYRNRVRFALRRSDSDVFAGYHAYDNPNRFVDVDCCPLAEESINRVWAELRRHWGERAQRLPAADELQLTLRSTVGGSVGLLLEGGSGAADTAGLLADVDGLDLIWLSAPGADTRPHGSDTALQDRVGDYSVPLRGDSFLQVNRAVAERVESYVRELCGGVSGRLVVDAYCGFGLRVLALAEEGARAVGIERDASSIAAAERAAKERTGARFVAARVETALSRELPADVVILNPPRRGVSGAVTKILQKRPPAEIIYVSCDPATLARDIARLGERFELTQLRGFDMFPQTAHVETVAHLKKND